MFTHLHPKHWRPELITLVALALITRFWSVLQPAEVVFDEVYFKAFAGHYLDGHYFFDIHPPLGKLLLAGWASLIHLSSSELLNGVATSLRYLPALAGTLLIPLFWGILRRLGVSRPLAFLGAAALLLDNALTVESRLILMDPLLLLFGLGALWAYLGARTTQGNARWLWLTLSATLAGAAASTKWTGLTALALVGLLWLADQSDWRRHWGRRLGELALLIALPSIVYLGSFATHFALLTRSGEGDAFMSARFQQTLPGNTQYNPHTHLSFWAKFGELNSQMYRSNQTLTATHPYGSRWYTWPLELRPIYYWAGPTDSQNRQGHIYLLGNPFVWWGTIAAILTGLILAYRRRTHLRPATKAALGLTGAAYLMNFMPFMGVPRVMFLYHYFFSFVFSVAFAVLLWNDIGLSRRALLIALGALAAGFLFFAPLTYGWPLTPAQLQLLSLIHI